MTENEVRAVGGIYPSQSAGTRWDHPSLKCGHSVGFTPLKVRVLGEIYLLLTAGSRVGLAYPKTRAFRWDVTFGNE
jgi:hypothetical protein